MQGTRFIDGKIYANIIIIIHPASYMRIFILKRILVPRVSPIKESTILAFLYLIHVLLAAAN